MVVGIDGSRAFLKRRTGIEEYSYQIISHLCSVIPANVRVVLYIRSGQTIDLKLPSTWEVKSLSAPRLWTQGRLSLELLFHPVDVLFVPAHTIPFIHPRRTIVTVHGLEYEFCPQGYSLWEQWYMRISIRFSCGVAERIIAVSENTKRDLTRLYGISPEKIRVIHEGYEPTFLQTSLSAGSSQKFPPFFLFIGRLEDRKNVIRIIEAYELFKAKTGLPHELILIGRPGYGYEAIKKKIQNSKFQIRELGYVPLEEKRILLAQASVFVFPSLYEGFGLPVLEAQVAGVPVITSSVSSLPEVAGDGAVLIDPQSTESITQAMTRLVTDEPFRAGIIQRATANAARFSWERCAQSMVQALLHQE